MLTFVPCALAERIGEVEVGVQPLPSLDNYGGSQRGVSHGYIEYRVQLNNRGKKPATVHLTYPGAARSYGDYGVVSRRTVQLAPGQQARVSLFQPATSGGSTMLSVRVDGVARDGDLPVSQLYSYHYESSGAPAAILVSRAVPQEFRDREYIKPKKKPEEATPKPAEPPEAYPSPAPVLPPGATPEEPTDPFAFLRSEVPVNLWSDNWLGYSCFDAVILDGDEAEQLPPPVQLALRRYCECGGTLYVRGQKAPDVFITGGRSDGKNGWLVGFGRVVAGFPDGSDGWKALYENLRSDSPPVYRPTDRPARPTDLLVGESTVPVRGLFVLVLLFGIGIGPVNIWLLSHYKRRIWLWWNVPLISLATCLAVFGYALASEGWTARGKIVTFTLLDERAHRATTLGIVSYYCPLTPSGGALFSAESDVALLAREQPEWRRYGPYAEDSGGMKIIDWTAEQRLRSGWLPARNSTYFQYRKNEDRRERLSIERAADGSLVVVNALGADIRRLYLADASGKLHEGRAIAAGAKAKLEPLPDGTKADGTIGMIAWYTAGNLLGAIDAWNRGTPAKELQPGSYFAFLDRSPFADRPLSGADCEDTAAIVYGISKGEDDGR